ncbi:MAG: hypothetical protein Q4C68_03020 [Moraxella sp.]|nr:hypothetical protein [Moraxella sp.]
MKKSLVINTIVIMTALTGCATTSKTTTDQQHVAKMQVAPVKLILTQKYQNDTFYDESTLAKKMTACIQDELSKTGKFSTNSTDPKLTLSVDYKRTYSGEAFGMNKTIGDVRFGYDYQITQNNQVLQQNSAKDRIAHQGLITIFTMGLGNSAQASEDKFIVGVCQDIIETIK